MLWKIVLLILSSFFLNSAWAFFVWGKGGSPINIDPKSIEEYRSSKMFIFNNKYSNTFYTTINKTGDQIVKIIPKKGGDIPYTYGGALERMGVYFLKEIAIYLPSEHRIANISFDLEMTMVYWSLHCHNFENALGKPLGILIQSQFFNCVEGNKGDIEKVINFLKTGETLKFSDLHLNFGDTYYVYIGDFLRPPYYGHVIWMINPTPKTITYKQHFELQKIREKLLEGMAYTKIQPINERKIVKYT